MSQEAIFGPFFAVIFLTLAVWVYLYSRRLPFIFKNGLTNEQLAVPGQLAKMATPAVINPADNLRNLFEIPVIFYALVLYLYLTQQVDALYVQAAWAFFVFRVLHSAIHCTFNLVSLRFAVYVLSTLAVWFIAFRAAFAYFR